MADKVDLSTMKIVRGWDMLDGWYDVTGPVTEAVANAKLAELTGNGTHNTKYSDGDYYAIFPADTKMIFTPEFYGR